MRTIKKTISVLLLLPLASYASFIETTQGTAVVNDATASYFNPAALMLLKNPQIIPQGTGATFSTHFSGQTTPVATGITEIGSSRANTNYFSPALYMGMPLTNKIFIGLAMVSNSASRNVDEQSVLRYVQSNNDIQDYDVVPALAIKLAEWLSLGGGVNFSFANFDLQPISGFPDSNVADSRSRNKSNGSGIGGNIGFLIKPSPVLTIGFNYRSLTNYNLSGSSVFEGAIRVVSENYHFKLSTPARSVFSINYFVTPKLGLITTIQRIQWSIVTNTHVYGIASASGTTPLIVNGIIPDYLHNTWVVTLGSHYQVTPKWIVRVAGTYNQSPGNPSYQLITGDSIVLGGSMGYKINSMFTVDGSYAHAFIKDQNIDITGNRLSVQGVNSGSRDAISLKLTINV